MLRKLFPLFFLSTNIIWVGSVRPEMPAEIQELFDKNLSDWRPTREYAKAFPYYLCGRDVDNRPIWVLDFGKWDLRSFIERSDEDEKMMETYVDHAVLTVYNTTISENGVSKATGLMDWEGFQEIQLLSIKTMNFIMKKLPLIYVALGHLDYGYLINVNFFAESLLSIAKPILGEKFEKLEILGTNKAKWKETILKTLPKEKLPKWYGGIGHFRPIKVYG